MRTRFACSLDGQPLEGVAPCLAILDIRESAPALTCHTARPARGEGTLLLSQSCDSRPVTIVFALRDRSPARRGEAMEAVQRWSRGSRLEVSSRPGRFLTVCCTTLPAVDSAQRWSEGLKIVFTAYEVPFWQDKHLSRAILTGAAGSGVAPLTGSLYAGGTARETPVDVQVKNTSASATCQHLTLTAGESRFAFTGLALLPGETLRAQTDDRDRLALTILSAAGSPRSAMACRTGDSSDALLLPCGARSAVSISAEESVTLEAAFQTRGRWL